MKVEMNFVLTACLFNGVLGLYDPVTRLTKPHVETYWESWEDGLNNFASNLTDVPVTPLGSVRGVNVVNLAFADPAILEDIECEMSRTCITSGLEMKDSGRLHEAVNLIHAAGGFVKIAFGGEVYGNPGDRFDNSQVDLMVSRIVHLVDEYNLDGVDLTAVRDCGAYKICPYAEPLVWLIRRLRELMPNKIISFTFPHRADSLTYNPILMGSHQYVSYIMTSQWAQSDIDLMVEMGVPNHKIVPGQIIHRDCGMSKTVEAAETVVREQLGGVMTWSINSDTYHREGNEAGACTYYQTGRSDATFVNAISYILNSN